MAKCQHIKNDGVLCGKCATYNKNGRFYCDRSSHLPGNAFILDCVKTLYRDIKEKKGRRIEDIVLLKIFPWMIEESHVYDIVDEVHYIIDGQKKIDVNQMINIVRNKHRLVRVCQRDYHQKKIRISEIVNTPFIGSVAFLSSDPSLYVDCYLGYKRLM